MEERGRVKDNEWRKFWREARTKGKGGDTFEHKETKKDQSTLYEL